MDLNLWALFESVCESVPEREAIVWRDRRSSYHDLRDRARRLAVVLADHGLGIHAERADLEPWAAGQDLVGLYLLNGPEYLEATLAGHAARCAPFNVNYRYVADELTYLLDDAGAGALVYHARFAPTLAEVLPRLARRPLLLQVADESGQPLLDGAVDYETALAAADPAATLATGTPDDLYVLYTGGTTGMPKGTLWRQGDIWMAALGGAYHEPDTDTDAVAAAVAASPTLRVLPNAPLMHGAAHWISLRALLSGQTVVINDIVDRLDPVDVWTTIERERVTSMLMVGEAFARPLLDELDRTDHDVDCLQLVLVGGAVTGPETKRRLIEHIPHLLIADIAGASETGSALRAVSSSAGVPEPGLFQPEPDVTVLDVTLTRVLEPGEDAIGWLGKRGRIPLGYLGDQAKTQRTFPIIEGVRWSVPGDLARLRADGTLELLGRDSATINSGGEKIFAEEVEAAILTHPAVQDVIVVGRPSDRWGQEVVAVLELVAGAGGVDDDDVCAIAAQRIARYKVPKAIVRVSKVERSPAGKADYAWARNIAHSLEPVSRAGVR